MVDFKDLSFHLRAVGDLEDNELDDILNFLHESITEHERMELEQLEKFYSILNKWVLGACPHPIPSQKYWKESILEF